MVPLIPIVAALAQFAPTVMRVVGASADSTAAAGQVAAIAQAVTGTQTPDEAVLAIQQSSQAQAAFAQRVAELDAQLEQARLADVADARKRDVALAQAGRRNARADLMVLLDVLGLIACLVVLALYRRDLPPEAATLLTTIASLFGLCLRDAHQFEFGSSRGSRDKDALMAQQQQPSEGR